MKKKNCLAWLHCCILLIVLICPISFAFTTICAKMIPGVWFVAKMRLLVMSGVFEKAGSAWSNTVSLDYEACFSTTAYSHEYPGLAFEIIVWPYEGPVIKCTPLQPVVRNPYPGTYTYNVWGLVVNPQCKGGL